MKRFLIAIFLYFFIISFAWSFANLNVIDDTVSLKSSGSKKFNVVKGKQPLIEGQLVQTNKSGKALVEYEDGSVFKLANNTLISFKSKIIEMKRGTANYRFVKQKGKFMVVLPNAIMSILGTSFSISLDKKRGSLIKMTEGRVKITSKKESKIIVSGQIIRVKQDGEILVSSQVNPLGSLPFTPSKKKKVKKIEQKNTIETQSSPNQKSDNSQVPETAPQQNTSINTLFDAIKGHSASAQYEKEQQPNDSVNNTESSDSYKCPFCNKEFSTKYSFSIHKASCTSKSIEIDE